MAEIGLIWIERMWDRSGYWLKADQTAANPTGEAVELHRYCGVHDRDSFEEIDGILHSWGFRFDGMSFRGPDDNDRTYVTIAVEP